MANPRLRALACCKKFTKEEVVVAVAGLALIIFSFSFLFKSSLKNTASTFPLGTEFVEVTLLRSAKDRGAFCLDGSLPAYHFEKGFASGSSNWVLHIEGGGWCDSIASCLSRKTTALGSSHHMELQVKFSGILSHDPAQNPDFFNWNKVKLRYCDGASFAGNPESEFHNGTNLFFRGQLIWEAFMDELLAIGMSNASQTWYSDHRRSQDCRPPSTTPTLTLPGATAARMEQSQNSQGGSRMDASQSSQIGKGKNKRFWTKEEEWALMQGLLELCADPQWKAEGNFKSGYLVKLEEMMNAKCPGSGLKAYPHIDSKTKWFRDKYNVLVVMCQTSGFTWDDATKMIKCERQSYDDFCKNHKHAKGLWGVPFPFLDELGKIFGADRATGASCEDYVEAVDNLRNDNEAIDLDKDEEDAEEVEDESVQSAQQSPQLSKRARKEKASTGKGKKRMSEVIDLTSTFTNVSSDISTFMSGMNSHLETIASAFTTTQQHEQVIMARELHHDQKEKELDAKKKGLFNEVMKIPGLTRVEAMLAAKKLVSDESSLTIFYECPDDEWKKDFIINLIHPDLPPSIQK